MDIWKHSVMKNFDERIQEEQHMCKVISITNQKGGVVYEKLHIMQSR